MPRPGGIIAFAPGGSLMGKSRAGVIEVKMGPSFLVVIAEPGTRLLNVDTKPEAEGWHVTIHQDLMVHARSRDGRAVIPLLNDRTSSLVREALLLLRVKTAPEPYRVLTERQQNVWEGGVAIFSPVTDERYKEASTVLVLEVWAVPLRWAAGGLPPHDPRAWPAYDRTSRLEVGPVPAVHAFRTKSAPDVAFYYSYWWIDSPDRSATIEVPGVRIAL